MSDHENPEGELSPAERRLSEHLDLLRASPPSAAPELIGRIVRQARWQRAIRGPLVLMGAVASAFADGLGLLLRRSAGRR
ncbi:MAG: hypothetical protein ACJ76X_10785 [Solirubrobacteraceae bacterium]|jgi:hypothetical protein